MDASVEFVDPDSFPGQYLPSEASSLEVTWDDVPRGAAFVLEGSANVIRAIIAAANKAGDIKRVVFL